MAEIHPSAIVSPEAVLASDVRVGAYAVIGSGVTVKRGTTIGSHVCIDGITEIGEGCQICPHVVMGTAPDAFDGVHMKSEWLSDGAGAWGKPYMRGYVGGGTGVFAGAQGWYHVASGLFDTCLVVCEEKMSPTQPL